MPNKSVILTFCQYVSILFLKAVFLSIFHSFSLFSVSSVEHQKKIPKISKGQQYNKFNRNNITMRNKWTTNVGCLNKSQRNNSRDNPLCYWFMFKRYVWKCTVGCEVELTRNKNLSDSSVINFFFHCFQFFWRVNKIKERLLRYKFYLSRNFWKTIH